MNFIQILKDNFPNYNIMDMSLIPLDKLSDKINEFKDDNIVYLMKTADNKKYFKYCDKNLDLVNKVTYSPIERLFYHKSKFMFLCEDFEVDEKILIRCITNTLLINPTCMVCYGENDLFVCKTCNQTICISCIFKLEVKICPNCREKMQGFKNS